MNAYRILGLQAETGIVGFDYRLRINVGKNITFNKKVVLSQR